MARDRMLRVKVDDDDQGQSVNARSGKSAMGREKPKTIIGIPLVLH